MFRAHLHRSEQAARKHATAVAATDRRDARSDLQAGAIALSRCFFAGLLLLSSNAVALDPTQPPADLTPRVTADTPVMLRLQAILNMPSAPRAIINGHTLSIGDQLAGARIMAIQHHSVLIERDGTAEVLRLAVPIITPSRTRP